MEKLFHSGARWIWINKQEEQDEYASFLEAFSYKGGSVLLRLAAEINYIAYVNGRRVAFGQFPGYLHEKYVDEIDITEFCIKGKNELRIVVRYEGCDTANHICDKAGVIFEVCSEEEVLCSSTVNTLGGMDAEYQQHVCRGITPQLGLSVNMCKGSQTVYGPCREAELSYHFCKRPVKKLVEEPLVRGKALAIPGRRIYDFEKETAGYVIFRVKCPTACEAVLAYGEHLEDGKVRQHIGIRDFSMHFQCTAGENNFEVFFLRIAGRYIELLAPEEVEVQELAVVPLMYPIEEVKGATQKLGLTGLDKQIYDTCVRTLRLCMHEHYEDCPWREQALYVLDSRNQMLAGYYAFEDASFARANLVFISKGLREDGLLELTYPAVHTPAIPFFSMMYPKAVLEYIEHTGDESILEEVMPTIRGIMRYFAERIGEDGLLHVLPEPYWNFYEWSEGSDGEVEDDRERHELILNCAYVYVARAYGALCEMCGETFEIATEDMKKAIIGHFYDKEKGMYFLSDAGARKYGQLGNAFAALIGLTGTNLEAAVRGEQGVIPATLSMMPFIYDALLEQETANAGHAVEQGAVNALPASEREDTNAGHATERETSNRQFVLEDIRRKYGFMLEQGATSFWETMEGASAFGDAGSLCHGWSAMPIYYYHKLMK